MKIHEYQAKELLRRYGVATPRGKVSVSASTMFGRMIVAPILLDLLDRYPEISITTLFVNRMIHLVDEGIDIAVRIGELPDSSLSAIRVGSIRRVLCGSPGEECTKSMISCPANSDGVLGRPRVSR